MTQVALVCMPVPGSVAGIIIFGGIAGGGAAAGEQAGRVGNYVVCVVLAHNFVKNGAVDSRSTGTAFEVKDKCGARDDFLATAWADDILWTMDRRKEMIFKIALRLEIPLAGRAIVVRLRLTIVLLQTIFIGEDLFTG